MGRLVHRGAELQVPGDEDHLGPGGVREELPGQLDAVLALQADVQDGDVRGQAVAGGVGQGRRGGKGVDMIRRVRQGLRQQLLELAEDGGLVVTKGNVQHSSLRYPGKWKGDNLFIIGEIPRPGKGKCQNQRKNRQK